MSVFWIVLDYNNIVYSRLRTFAGNVIRGETAGPEVGVGDSWGIK